MKYLQCEQILAYRNDYLEVKKQSYQQYLISYEHLKNICQKPNLSAKMQNNKEASLIFKSKNKVELGPRLCGYSYSNR
ncbi:hypothetical protein [Acinetobacter boissieri]|uniref:Uncharacterized protein n=1 Tax=Acinetobacter boissieri TaxID=1219383 RepID=A0A1G6JR50_9GAMM|nr:hypothetical protein [Acinetobacter boissieri]SDC21158.1 hypothetical protein SAMN05421733_11233 [Acinetobacter boissieri]